MGTFTLIMAGIQAAVAAAPGVIAVFTDAKHLTNAAFGAKLITKAQQDELHAECDARMAAGLADERPAALVVDAD